MLIDNRHVAVDPSRARQMAGERASSASAFEERDEGRETFPFGRWARGKREEFLSLESRRTRADSTNEVTLERRPRDFCDNLLQPTRARAHAHTHTRTHRHRDWTVNEPARRTNRRPDSPRGFSSRFSRASILLLSDWASAGDGGRGGGSRFTG